MKTGLYFHVPFCRSKCRYCAFYSVPSRNGDQRFQGFTQRIIQDIKTLAGKNIDVETIYFGGGTPSLLGHKSINDIMGAVTSTLTLLPGAEVTLEMNPEDFSSSLVQELVKTGINRIVLGVQSLDGITLSTIGRNAGPVSLDLLDTFFSEPGVQHCLDLIIGIPGYPTVKMVQDLRRVINYRPDHVSVYLLSLEEGTPLYNEVTGNDEFYALQEEQFHATRDVLIEAGYHHYEVSNFSLPGKESRHNTRYWNMEDYHGFGPGAHSLVKGNRFFCDMTVDQYLDSDSSRYRTDERTSDDLVVEYIMTGLRKLDGFSLDRLGELAGHIPSDVKKRLDDHPSVIHEKNHGTGMYRVEPEQVLFIDRIAYEICEPWIRNT